jgi:homoserine kinase
MPDAIFNVQKVALLTSAICNQDEEALYEALHDRLHEPYRESLVAELPRVREHLRKLPILGCVLSGAGPSILVIVNQKNKALILEELKSWAPRQSAPPQILDLKVDQQGLREIHG